MKWLVITIISLAISFVSCRENTDGCCDDSLATNFDPEAEESTCCKYPEIILGMNHIFSDDSTNVIPDTGLLTVPASPDSTFQIVSSAWFFQGFQFFVNGQWVDVEEQTTVSKDNGDEQRVFQNFDVHERRSFRLANLGISRSIITPDSIRFSLGWQDIQLDTSDIELRNNPPLLNAKTLELYDKDHSILQSRIELRVLNGLDTTIYKLPINGETQLTYEINPVTWDRGFDRRIQLNLSYDQLLANYSFTNDVITNVRTIISNINNETIELDTIY